VPAVSDPDVALMLAFAKGREEAFVELYHRYRDRLVTYTQRMLGDQARAEDAAQEVFLKLYRARDSYQAKSRFSTFLYRIATNHCLNQRARLEQHLVDGDADHDALATNHLDQQQRLAQKQLAGSIEQALSQLPERQRAALLLVHYEGMSYREAAESLEVSEQAIKAMIHRARATLMTELGPQLEEPLELAHGL
jgi:RNA polymerase sigma-70 factor (ECF subfamily)